MESSNKKSFSSHQTEEEKKMQQKIGHIKELLGKDELKSAIQEIIFLLKKSKLYDVVIVQMAVFTDLEKAYQKGIIDWKEARKEKNKLTDTLLRLVNLFDNPNNEINENSILIELENINKQLPKKRLSTLSILVSIIIVISLTFSGVLYSQGLYSNQKVKWDNAHEKISGLINRFKYSPKDSIRRERQKGLISAEAKKLYKELKEINREGTFSTYDKALLAYDAQLLLNIINMTTLKDEIVDSNVVKPVLLGNWSSNELNKMVSEYDSKKLNRDFKELYDYVIDEEVIDDINYQLLISLGVIYYHFEAIDKNELQKLRVENIAEVKTEINNIYNQMGKTYKMEFVHSSNYHIIQKLLKDEII